MSTAKPLTDAECTHRLAAFAFEPNPRVVVALSGGVDSMALCWLLHRWAKTRSAQVIALTVDHRLRPESTQEAEAVGRLVAQWGIQHHILPWEGVKPAGNRQEAARNARYALIENWCATRGILHVITAHHGDDQAETLLLRLARGSGVEGLAGMPAQREMTHIRLLRPFLDIPKSRLQATLTAAGIAWMEDASNHTALYDRNTLRHALTALDEPHLPERLRLTTTNQARARVALEHTAAQVAAASIQVWPWGACSLVLAAWRDVPEEIRLRLLSRMLSCVSGATQPPRMEALLAAMEWLETDVPSHTLHGCQLLRQGDATMWIVREPAQAAAPMPLTSRPQVWDHRFTHAAAEPAALSIGLLGYEGVRQYEAKKRPWPVDAPRKVWAAATGLWQGDAVHSIAGAMSAPGATIQFIPPLPLAPAFFAPI